MWLTHSQLGPTSFFDKSCFLTYNSVAMSKVASMFLQSGFVAERLFLYCDFGFNGHKMGSKMLLNIVESALGVLFF